MNTPETIAELQRIEADLLDKLQRCIPPVDQHRTDLERVRSQLARATSEAPYDETAVNQEQPNAEPG